jgi:ribose transport system substrate-binding protein
MTQTGAPIFGLILKNQTNPAYGGAIHGATATAAKHGASVIVRSPAKPDDVDEQIAIVEQMISDRPAAIILLPAHPTALNPSIEAVHRAGIPLVLAVSRPENVEAVTYVSSDDYKMAYTLGRFLAAEMKIGKAAIIDGHPNALTTPLRHRGFADAIAESPGIELVDFRSGYFQHATGRKAAEDILATHKQIGGFFVANDLMAMGALEALAAAGSQAQMVSINGTPDAVNAIKQGKLLATALFNTLFFGALAAEAAVRHLKGERVPTEITLPSPIISRANLAEYDKPYPDRRLPVWSEEVR